MDIQTPRPLRARRQEPTPALSEPPWRPTARAAVAAMIVASTAALAACGERPSTGAEPAHAAAESGDPVPDDHAEEDVVRLSADEAHAAGVELAAAKIEMLSVALSLPAEVRFDPDRIANVAPPVGGVIRGLEATEGDVVAQGQTLAVLSSRELADLKAEFLTAQSTEALVRLELGRADELASRNVASQAQLQTARAELAGAAAAREAAETKLHALGLGHDVLDGLLEAEDGALSLFPLTAPIAGQVVRRDATLGQSIEDGGAREPMFVIADASVVWIDIAVFKNDVARVHVGAPVVLVDEAGTVFAEGAVSFISPVIDETSRTATARVVVDNAEGRLRPGQFVTARIDVGGGGPVVRVAEAAVQTVEGRDAVFVPVEAGFAPRAVAVGRRAGGYVEILAGLERDERYVASGAFTLKAELEEAGFGDGHAH